MAVPTPHPGSPYQRPDGPDADQRYTNPLPATRQDLLISPQLYLGRTVYVIKDPVSLSYFRVEPAEHFLFHQLDGRASAQELAERVNARFGENPTDPEGVLRFMRMLQGAGLLQGRTTTHGQMLRQMRNSRKRRLRIATWSNFLFIRIPVFDPDRPLERLIAVVGPLMNRTNLILGTIFMAISLVAALVGMHHVGQLWFPILSVPNMLLLSVTFFAVKVIHEFGHGLAAKQRDLEVHEMGVLLMVFLPLFYVDVSDAWMLPRRRDRLWITAGGVFIEFLLASVAVWVWLYTAPGIVNQCAFNIMLAASISTLLFNANPLLRYDGYYFLMDWMQIPNLRVKAWKYVGYLAKLHLLRLDDDDLMRNPQHQPPAEALRHPIFMVVFAITSGIYRWMVVFGIIVMVWHVLDPYDLEVIGSMMGAIALVTMVIWPLVKLMRFLWSAQTQTWRRAGLSIAAIAGMGFLTAAILQIPTSQTLERPAVILAAQRQPIFVAEPGRVEQVYARTGQLVSAGQPLIRLNDEDLTDQLRRLRVERQMVELRIAAALQAELADRQAGLRAQLRQLDGQLLHMQAAIEQLTIRAPISGRCQFTIRLETMIGQLLKRGEEMGMVIGAEQLQLVVVMPQDEAALVRPHALAQARFWALPDRVFTGQVQQVSPALIRLLPHVGLSAMYGGEVDTAPSADSAARPSDPSLCITVQLDPLDAYLLRDGMTGRGKIEIGRRSLGSAQWRRIRQVLSLDWWL